MKIRLQSLLCLLLSFFVGVQSTLADPPGPPNPGGDPTGTGGVPVGAPIDNGIFVLLLLAVIYGGYKIYELRKNKTKTADSQVNKS